MVDAGRTLERWLLERGIPFGNADLLKELLNQLR